MVNRIEVLRKELYKEIDLHGLDYEKVIEADKKLHEEIIKEMKFKNLM